MDETAIKQASDKLELRDIVLHTFSLVRDLDRDPALYPGTVHAESDLQVAVDQILFTDGEDQEIPILRAYVRLSVGGYDREGNPEIELFRIRAEYRVDYLITAELTRKDIQVFGDFNSVHNVWPFWRQYVQQTVNQANLPRVMIPLFRRPPGSPKPKRTPRRTPRAKIRRDN